MKELRQMRDAVIGALREAGLAAETAFPERRVSKMNGPFASVSVGAAEGKTVGFCNYLGEVRGADGSLQELYGKRLEGVILVEVRGVHAQDCDSGCEIASCVLLGGLPGGIQPGELTWEALCWEKNLQMFRRRGRLSCTALFTACQKNEGEFLDFILKGVLSS